MPTVEDAAALLPHLAQLRLERVLLKAGRVRIEATTTGSNAACPSCGMASARMHSRYTRRLVDSAIGGREVLVTLRVRRLFCDHPDCARRTFAEQVPGLTAWHGRRTRCSPAGVDQQGHQPLPVMRGFAKGLHSDFDAVRAGLTLEWNSGKVVPPCG